MCTQAEPYGSEPHSEKQIADAFAGDVFGARGYWGHHPCSLSLHSFLMFFGPDRCRPSQMDPCWSVVQLWPLWQGWVG